MHFPFVSVPLLWKARTCFHGCRSEQVNWMGKTLASGSECFGLSQGHCSWGLWALARLELCSILACYCLLMEGPGRVDEVSNWYLELLWVPGCELVHADVNAWDFFHVHFLWQKLLFCLCPGWVWQLLLLLIWE